MAIPGLPCTPVPSWDWPMVDAGIREMKVFNTYSISASFCQWLPFSLATDPVIRLLIYDSSSNYVSVTQFPSSHSLLSHTYTLRGNSFQFQSSPAFVKKPFIKLTAVKPLNHRLIQRTKSCDSQPELPTKNHQKQVCEQFAQTQQPCSLEPSTFTSQLRQQEKRKQTRIAWVKNIHQHINGTNPQKRRAIHHKH